MFLLFEENDLFLNSINIKDNIITLPELICNIDLPFLYKKYFLSFFEKYKYTINIRIDIINDDGNILSLIINCIKYIFNTIELPLFLPYKHNITVSYELPECYGYCLYNNILITDPTKIEELSSDGYFYSLKIENEVNEFIFEKGSVDLERLIEFIK